MIFQAIANLSVNAEVAKSVASEGGISILATLAKSPNRWVAEEAAGGLWNLSVGEDHKVSVSIYRRVLLICVNMCDRVLLKLRFMFPGCYC